MIFIPYISNDAQGVTMIESRGITKLSSRGMTKLSSRGITPVWLLGTTMIWSRGITKLWSIGITKVRLLGATMIWSRYESHEPWKQALISPALHTGPCRRCMRKGPALEWEAAWPSNTWYSSPMTRTRPIANAPLHVPSTWSPPMTRPQIGDNSSDN